MLHVIHQDISASFSAAELSKIAAYSEQHFHRVFKQIVGESINVYIRRTRLEHAANQLMFDSNTRVLDIAQKCGFSSLSSFTHAFKRAFKVTPAQWRSTARQHKEPPYLGDIEIAEAYKRIHGLAVIEPKLIRIKPVHVAYVRHKGYGRSIRKAWQTLESWCVAHQTKFGGLDSDDISLCGQQIALHHSNPEWVELDDCHYVACVSIDRRILRRGIVNSLTIPGGLHAVFDLTGKYGELLPLIGNILSNWLPSSGYVLQTTPMLVHYRKNHLIDSDETFDVQLHLPIATI